MVCRFPGGVGWMGGMKRVVEDKIGLDWVWTGGRDVYDIGDWNK